VRPNAAAMPQRVERNRAVFHERRREAFRKLPIRTSAMYERS
jgi:hypothetical protein